MNTLPERPDLRQLRSQAKDLVRAVSRGDSGAIARVRPYFEAIPISLSDAQLVLAREAGFDSWPKLKRHCEARMLAPQLIQAIERGDRSIVESIVHRAPELVTETLRQRNRGGAFVYAAQCGELELVQWLWSLGHDVDLQHALSRAAMYAHLPVMRFLVSVGADPAGPYSRSVPDYGVVSSVCEVQNVAGLRALIELGAPLEWGGTKPVTMILGTYHRDPVAKHECLRLCEQLGQDYPDTPTMALHRGRIDLLARWLDRDPGILDRQWAEADIFPRELGLGPGGGLVGLEVHGVTLLHLAIEFDDLDAAEWLLSRGADPNARAEDGHTPLFHALLTMGRRDESKAKLLVDHGADPSIRATVHRRLTSEDDPYWSEARVFENVTALELAEAAPWPDWIRNQRAVEWLKTID